ncbi:MAG: ribbon-helix-helix protein, CopG family [Gammaproteobacteria bacterium]|nr:ribbon-helix-helix protein, CopG family [Gammaproteobacteria bacterium]
MRVKLTLRLEEGLIEKTKHHARRRGKSVSQIVADYLSLLTSKDSEQSPSASSPISHSLRGALRGQNVAEDDYHRYLVEKHL